MHQNVFVFAFQRQSRTIHLQRSAVRKRWRQNSKHGLEIHGIVGVADGKWTLLRPLQLITISDRELTRSIETIQYYVNVLKFTWLAFIDIVSRLHQQNVKVNLPVKESWIVECWLIQYYVIVITFLIILFCVACI